MNVSWRNAVLILAGWTLVNMAWAQTDDARAVLTRLSINQVAELDGHVYARVQDQRRGGTQALERLLIGRATVLAGHWLCHFTPSPNQRLDVNLQGVSLIYSREVDGVMDVVIKLKKQKPDCIVQTVQVRPEPMPSTSTSSTVSTVNAMPRLEPEQKTLQTIPATEPPDKGFKVRVYSTEH